jgi:cardiolipin synthase
MFYIMSVDDTLEEFFAALARARARGLAVRVLFDQVATARIPGSRKVGVRLKEAGIDYRAMLPFQPWRGVYQRPDLRNHRKILVVDSEVAYAGSQNIIEPGYHRRSRLGLQWLDLMVELRGPVVDGLEALFVTDWFHETDTLLDIPRALDVAPATTQDEDTWIQVVPSGPAFEGENNLRLFNGLMYSAQHHIHIVSPYLVPDDSMRYAITSAALRGVRVDVFVSEVSDQPLVFHAQRSYYEELLAAGVHIWLYPRPTVLHSKFVVIDGEVAVMGTSNLDMRSFSLNLELSLLMVGKKAVTELSDLAETYQEASRELTAREWDARSQRARFIEGLARLTATVQ